jgi:hypothetical protein
MQAPVPKQYLELRGRPIAAHSFITFSGMPEVKEIVIVCAEDWRCACIIGYGPLLASLILTSTHYPIYLLCPFAVAQEQFTQCWRLHGTPPVARLIHAMTLQACV